MKIFFLYGLTADRWLRLLRDNRFSIHPLYWHRALFLTIISLINSAYRRIEKKQFGAHLKNVSIEKPPLFILGHWRSGTTFLHNLLQHDPALAAPNMFQVVHPHTFLTTEQRFAKLSSILVPKRRPMDRGTLDWDQPSEDDVALCTLTPYAPYLAFVFPENGLHYLRYLTFRGVPKDQVFAWQESYLYYLKKLTYKYRKPLLLKSPPHTGRIKLLLRMFPEARFVHIVRHPLRVFQSCRHMFATLRRAAINLQPLPDQEGIDHLIMMLYETLYNAYFEEVSAIPRGQFHQLRFEDLEQNPSGELERMYVKLGLTGYSDLYAGLAAERPALPTYQKNTYASLSSDLKKHIHRLFRRQFDEWGYDLDWPTSETGTIGG